MSVAPTLQRVPGAQNFLFYLLHPSFLHLDGVTVDYYTATHGRGTGNGTAATVTVALGVYKSDRVTPITSVTIGGSPYVLPTTLSYYASGAPDNASLPWWAVVLPGALVPRPVAGLGTAQPVYLTASLTDSSENGSPIWPAPQAFADLLVVGQ